MTTSKKPGAEWKLTRKGRQVAKEFKRVYPIIKKFVKEDPIMRRYL